MTNKLYAKPILENRFWILESDGKKVGTICKPVSYTHLTLPTKA